MCLVENASGFSGYCEAGQIVQGCPHLLQNMALNLARGDEPKPVFSNLDAITG